MTKGDEILTRLRSLREDCEYSQDLIAKKIGINRTTYLRKEAGIIAITTDEWVRLSNILGVEVEYFFNLNDGKRAKDKKSRGGNRGTEEEDSEAEEGPLLRLYKTLTRRERAALITSLRSTLKDIKRKNVQQALNLLK